EVPDPFPTAPGAVRATELATALGELDPAAPVPDGTTIAELVSELARDERLGKPADVSIIVTDVETGTVLGEHQPDEARVPASTVKLLTAIAALEQVGPEATLDTRVLSASADRIVLVGGGDMMLAEGAGDPEAVKGRAGLGDLARTTASQLRLAGRTEVRLDFDDSLFSGPRLHPSWEDSYFNNGYVAPIAPMAVLLGA